MPCFKFAESLFIKAEMMANFMPYYFAHQFCDLFLIPIAKFFYRLLKNSDFIRKHSGII